MNYNATPDFKHNIAFIIPTRNRPELLTKLIRSIRNQTIKPDQVVIVDGSDNSIEPQIRRFLLPFFTFLRVIPPSLTKQRNAGVKALNEDITLVGYLDDDIILETDAVEAMLRFWEHSSDDVGGCSFNITNNPIGSRFERSIKKFFYIDNGKDGSVLRSGYNTIVSPVLKDTYTKWLCGGATVWRRSILEQFKYDEWFSGWAYIEDVDFSFRVAQKYRLVVLLDARVQHNPPPFNSNKRYILGKMDVMYRYHFINKHTYSSIPLFYFATIGLILITLAGGLVRRRLDGIKQAAGYANGLFYVFRKKLIHTDMDFKK